LVRCWWRGSRAPPFQRGRREQAPVGGVGARRRPEQKATSKAAGPVVVRGRCPDPPVVAFAYARGRVGAGAPRNETLPGRRGHLTPPPAGLYCICSVYRDSDAGAEQSRLVGCRARLHWRTRDRPAADLRCPNSRARCGRSRPRPAPRRRQGLMIRSLSMTATSICSLTAGPRLSLSRLSLAGVCLHARKTRASASRRVRRRGSGTDARVSETSNSKRPAPALLLISYSHVRRGMFGRPARFKSLPVQIAKSSRLIPFAFLT
jgi:hypothetical protein